MPSIPMRRSPWACVLGWQPPGTSLVDMLVPALGGGVSVPSAKAVHPGAARGQKGLGQPSDQRPLQWGQMERPRAYLCTVPGWGDRTRVYEGHPVSGTIVTPRL